jgi:lipoprotein-releasing system permease protein
MASANGRVEGILLRGMRTEDIRTNAVLTSGVRSGSLAALTPGCDCVAIGTRLATQLGTFPGGEISLISPEGRATPVGTVPRIVSYRVVATFETGVYDFDNLFVVSPMEDVQTLLMMGDEVGLVEVKVREPDEIDDQIGALSQIAQGRGQATDWRQMNAAIFEALEVERVAMFVVLSLIILVAVFNILSSLIMLVRAKTRDIAILRTMGASRRGLMKVFVTVGTTIGTLGILLGLVIGAIFLFFRQSVVNGIQWITGQNLWDPSVRFLSELPSKTDPVEVTAIVLTAFVLSFLATLYPAWKAASTDPVQVLRYE